MKRTIISLGLLLYLSSCGQNQPNLNTEKQQAIVKDDGIMVRGQNDTNAVTEKQTDCSCQSEDSAINVIEDLPEMRNFVKSNKGQRIDFMAYPNDDSTIYEIKVGFRGAISVQTRFIFEVEKNTCKINAYDPVSLTDKFPLIEWQKRYKKYLNGDENAFDEK